MMVLDNETLNKYEQQVGKQFTLKDCATKIEVVGLEKDSLVYVYTYIAWHTPNHMTEHTIMVEHLKYIVEGWGL